MSLVILPRQLVVDINGTPRNGARMYLYDANSTTPRPAYPTAADAAAATNPLTQPVETLSTGLFPAVFVATAGGDYKIIVKDAAGTTLYTEDFISPSYSLASDILTLIMDRSDDTAIIKSLQRTPSEIANSVTPTNYAYWPGHGLRYGTANDGVRLQAMINSGHECFIPNGSYSLGGTQLVGKGNIRIIGESIGGVIITYTGAQTAFAFVRTSNVVLEGFTLQSTADASNGLGIDGSARQITLRNVLIYGNESATNTGIGWELTGGAPGQAYSGTLYAENVNVLGYKYGIRGIGTDSNATWTTMTFVQCLINGRSAGPIAGSRGIWFDGLINGVGSVMLGGAIQGFDRPAEFSNGSYGMDLSAVDMEGNTDNTPIFGASVNAEYRQASAGGDSYEQRAFLGEAVYRRRIQTGRVIEETKFGPKHVITDASGGVEEFGFYRGASALDGGSPTLIFGGQASTSDDLLEAGRNYIVFPSGLKWCAGNNFPTVGTFNQGDIFTKKNAAAGGPSDYGCTTPGTLSAATDNAGDTDGSTSLINGMADTSDFFVGDYVTISAGFATTGPFKITAKTSTSINVNANSNAVAANVTISTPDPVWKVKSTLAA